MLSLRLTLIEEPIYLKVSWWHLKLWTEVEKREGRGTIETQSENKEQWIRVSEYIIEVKKGNKREAGRERDEIEK